MRIVRGKQYLFQTLMLLLATMFFYLFVMKTKVRNSSDELLFESAKNNVIFFNATKRCNYITHFNRSSIGLGNRMFLYATLYGLARTNNKTPIIHKSVYQLKQFFNSLSIKEVDFSLNNFEEDEDNDICCKYLEKSTHLACSKNITLKGYRISSKYFENYSNEIRKEFLAFNENIKNSCRNVVEKIIQNFSRADSSGKNSKNCLIIGAHMRRGDFLYIDNMKKGYIPATVQYLHTAIDYFDRVFSNSCRIFIILGNDYEWNLKNSPKRNDIFILKPSMSPALDLCILTMCNATIMSSGTFGWWAAYLAGGHTTYMKNQCVPGSNLCSQTNLEDFINPNWNWTAL